MAGGGGGEGGGRGGGNGKERKRHVDVVIMSPLKRFCVGLWRLDFKTRTEQKSTI